MTHKSFANRVLQNRRVLPVAFNQSPTSMVTGTCDRLVVAS